MSVCLYVCMSVCMFVYMSVLELSRSIEINQKLVFDHLFRPDRDQSRSTCFGNAKRYIPIIGQLLGAADISPRPLLQSLESRPWTIYNMDCVLYIYKYLYLYIYIYIYTYIYIYIYI